MKNSFFNLYVRKNSIVTKTKGQKRTVGYGYESESWGWGSAEERPTGVPGLTVFPRRALPVSKHLRLP